MKTEQICAVCGGKFIPQKHNQKCCSSECANKKAHETMKKYYECQHCGKLFWRPNAFRMKYCSPECQLAARTLARPKEEKPASTVYKRVCAWCGEEFETTFPNKIYCGSECSYNGNLKKKRGQWADAYVPRTHICKECGSEFTTEYGDMHSVFCCQSCADKYKHRADHGTERHKEYMRGAKKRREKQIFDAFIEDVDFDFIYRRDGGICQICGLPVHPCKGVDNNWDGTIDHIVPLSIGGEHSTANCQLAHRICNSLKCQQTEVFTVDWTQKAQENNYWRIKYEQYEKLMGA